MPHILVEKVKYNDKAPWPTLADGGGWALQRWRVDEYGDDPINWRDALPTPGTHEQFRIESVQYQNNHLVLGFPGTPYSSYTVQYRSSLLPADSWTNLKDVPASSEAGMRYVTNSAGAGASGTFFRIVTPAQ